MKANIEKAKRLLGQCFSIGFDGIDLKESVATFIKQNSIGGVTLFANNYESPAQVAELINNLQGCMTEGLPLIIAVDHEGGRVQRFKKPFTKFPPALSIGNLNSPKLAFDAAAVQAKELKAVGVNVNFAPVADINTNVKNPVIGDRSFGETEERVTKMVTAYARGYLTNGIQPVLKHFPGHGDTNKDSHFHLPKVSTPLETILDREVRPFTKAFRSHCEMVMTAHIIVECIDPKLPATLNPKILKDLLRDQLRYTGIIYTDDMEMKAITDHFGEVDAALLALEAGADILLYHTMPFVEKVFEPLLSKLTSSAGKKAMVNLEESSRRVERFKVKNFLPYKPVYIPELEKQIGTPENIEVLTKIEKLIAEQNAPIPLS